MARTKGSKGKKTLAKEMGMTLEEYNQYLVERIDAERGIAKSKITKDMYGGYLGNDKLLEAMDLPTGKVDEELNKNEEKEKDEKVDKILETVDKLGGTVNNIVQKVIDGINSNDKLTDEQKAKFLSGLKTPEQVEKEMEKEKDSLTLFPFDKVDVDELITKKKNKKQKDSPECSRCHQLILGAPPTRINLTYITTQASYRRQISEDRPLLCWNCLNKLNKIIDDFLLDDGSGIPPKFKIN